MLSIVVCTYNRSALLKDALESLAGQNLQQERYEVIIVDNASTDNTKEVAAVFTENRSNFRYVFEEKQGLSHARNAGFAASTGSYTGYLDDDAKAEPDWLSHAYRIAAETKPDIFGGPYYPFYLTGKPDWFKDVYQTMEHGKSRYLEDNEFVSGSNIFFRKSLLSELGGFDPVLGMSGNTLAYGEETALIARARKSGNTVYYCHDMKVFHLAAEYKLNPFWYLLSSFRNTSQAEKTFGKRKENTAGEATLEAIILVKAIFDGLQNGIFSKKNKDTSIENFVIENIAPLTAKLGRSVEQFEQLSSKDSGIDVNAFLSVIRKKDEKIRELESSLTYKTGKVILSPFVAVSSLFLKRLRKK